MLSRVADQVAMAVDNALIHAELQQEQDRRKLLLELTNAVVSNLELREVLRAVMTTSAIFVLDGGGDMDIILHAIRGLGGRC